MSTRAKQSVLWSASALLAAASLVALLWPLWLPVPTNAAGLELRGNQTASDENEPNAASVAVPPLNEFAAIWTMDLRRPLFDPPPPAPAPAGPAAPAPAPRPPLGLRLVGTAVERSADAREQSVALLATRNGTIEIRRVGQVIEEAGSTVQIVAVAQKTATLRVGDQETIIKIEETTTR